MLFCFTTLSADFNALTGVGEYLADSSSTRILETLYLIRKYTISFTKMWYVSTIFDFQMCLFHISITLRGKFLYCALSKSVKFYDMFGTDVSLSSSSSVQKKEM